MLTLHSMEQWKHAAGKTSVLLYLESKKGESLPPCQKALEESLRVKAGEVKAAQMMQDNQLSTVVFMPLKDEVDYDALEKATAALVKLLKGLQAKEAEILVLDGVLAQLSAAFYKQLLLSNYAFDLYKSSGFMPIKKDDKEKEKEEKLSFALYLAASYCLDGEKKKLEEAKATAEGILLARKLVNFPANVLTPRKLAEEAVQAAEKFGFDIEVFDEKQIQEMELKAFWSVAKGSDEPPRFMVMRYMNNKESDKLLALVGKGLTYDSGGYALKPAQGMDTMFCDMGGSAAVIGAISILAQIKAKVNVVAVVAACENMISGHAYRNGDIIESLAGKYIEVVNTDAEGRLTLADAISYAATVLNADQIIDIATLTGAVGIALGDEISGVLSDTEEIWEAIKEASEKSGDKVWRLPHHDCLAEKNKSERADIKNSGGRYAGSCTAGLFCRAFAFGKQWGHIDIAGTAYHESGNAKAPNGATGVGAEMLALVASKLFR